MRLSERMILGATLIKHVPYASGVDEGCAIQCAVAANMHDTADMDWMNKEVVVDCPVEGCRPFGCGNTVGGMIVHLNDDHKWSIDRIAQWVAPLEPQEPPTEPLAIAEQQTEVGVLVEPVVRAALSS